MSGKNLHDAIAYAHVSMYPESDELTVKVSSLKVTIRLVLGWPRWSKMSRDQKLKPVGLCPRDTVAFKPTNASPTLRDDTPRQNTAVLLKY